MSEVPSSPSLPRQLLLFVGFPCAAPAIWGGIALIAGIAAGSFDLVALALCLGGLSGMWGTETLRSRPGYRTREAIVATIVGLASVATLTWLVSSTMR